MSKPCETVSISIDNRPIKVVRGTTILEAARQNDIYIPTLCAHKDLAPYGGCRMCIVEVEKMRGFPTSCTTPVEDGMMIRTHTAQLQSIRTEILRLILSEHPSSCLICEEAEECKQYMATIRKTGVITGCRWCPNDGRCELQEVVEWLGVKEIGYPVYYRNLRVEKEDPFYDRDYNLCILCGRCIRVCHEVRAANTLAFKQRGNKTVIGPAFSRTHLESGCEFCGACVEVCPTGALSEKTRKWTGRAEAAVTTTCALCGVGCQINLQLRSGALLGALPADDALVNKAQLCVKGRFAITELVGNFQRLSRPYRMVDGTRMEITMDEAIAQAATRLSTCAPEDFAMVVSPTLSNEDLYIAQKFTRTVMRTHNIINSATNFYGSAFDAYLDLLKFSLPLADLSNASIILCLGLDLRFGRSVVGVELRRALKRGAKVISIHPRQHSLSLIAELWLRPAAGHELDLIEKLMNLVAGGQGSGNEADSDLARAAELLQKAPTTAILIGTEFLHYHHGPQILQCMAGLAEKLKAGVMPLPAQSNLLGSISMGAFAEFLPGGLSSAKSANIAALNQRWNAKMREFAPGQIDPQRKISIAYYVGEVPHNQALEADYSIVQNIYPPDPISLASLALPSAAFTEVDGTVINGEGRVQRFRQAVNPPGEAWPDWQILCRLAQAMGVSGFEYADVADIFAEISELAPGFLNFDYPPRSSRRLLIEREAREPMPRAERPEEGDGQFPLLLTTAASEHLYRGFSLNRWVAGMRTILPEATIMISAADAAQYGLADGDEVIVSSTGFEKTWPVRIWKQQNKGALHLILPQGEYLGPNPHRVNLRKKNV